MNLLDALIPTAKPVEAGSPTIAYGVVDSIDPLTVTLYGDDDPLEIVPSSAALGLLSGDTVMCSLQDGELIILGAVDPEVDWVEELAAGVADAQEASLAALLSADGKATVYRCPAAEIPATVTDGDLWFDTENDNKPHVRQAGAWVPTVFGDAAIGNLDAGKITTGELAASEAIYLGAQAASHVRLDSTGIVRRRYDPDEAALVESFHLGGDSADWLELRDDSGIVTASIDQRGAAAFASVTTNALQVGGLFFSDFLASAPRGIVGYVDHTSSSPSLSTTGAEVGYIEFRAQLQPNRTYEIKVGAHIVDASEAGPVFQGQVRVAFDGASVTTSSPLLVASPVKRIAVNSAQDSCVPYVAILTTESQSADYREARFLYTVQKSSGSGSTNAVASTTQPITCSVSDIGPAVQATASVTKRVTTWSASSARAMGGDGAPRTDATYLGYSSSPLTVGNCYIGQNWSQLVFAANSTSGDLSSTVATATSGASLIKAEVYLFCQYAQAGDLTFRIHANNLTILSTSPPSGASVNATIPVGSGKWVDITGIWDTSKRGLWISSPSPTSAYHGHIRSDVHPTVSSRPVLRLTYRK